MQRHHARALGESQPARQPSLGRPMFGPGADQPQSFSPLLVMLTCRLSGGCPLRLVERLLTLNDESAATVYDVETYGGGHVSYDDGESQAGRA